MKYKFEMTDDARLSRIVVETDSIFIDDILDNFKSFLQASGFGLNHDDVLKIESSDREFNESQVQVKSWFNGFPQVKSNVEYSVRLKTDMPDDEKIEHVDFMCREHDVSVSFEDDEVIYKGPLEIIKKAVIIHYQSLALAKYYHPELFAEV